VSDADLARAHYKKRVMLFALWAFPVFDAKNDDRAHLRKRRGENGGVYDH